MPLAVTGSQCDVALGTFFGPDRYLGSVESRTITARFTVSVFFILASHSVELESVSSPSRNHKTGYDCQPVSRKCRLACHDFTDFVTVLCICIGAKDSLLNLRIQPIQPWPFQFMGLFCCQRCAFHIHNICSGTGSCTTTFLHLLSTHHSRLTIPMGVCGCGL